MPIYEYICLNCKNEVELIRPMGQADAPLACEACGGERLKRKLAVFYAHSGGHAVSGTAPAPSCSGCAGGNCSSCGH
ncbi:MAG: FmdB family zinc ribbon protein [Chloroflexota bacterium]